MTRVRLIRAETGDQGTFGRVYVNGLSLFTGELPWRDNASNISCIPPAPSESESVIYKCVWTYSVRFKRYMYLIVEVPNRFGVRKHAANLMGDTTKGLRAQLNGCIALGEKLGWIDGQKAVLLSRPAMRRFEDLMRGEPFDLEVRNGLA